MLSTNNVCILPPHSRRLDSTNKWGFDHMIEIFKGRNGLIDKLKDWGSNIQEQRKLSGGVKNPIRHIVVCATDRFIVPSIFPYLRRQKNGTTDS